MSDLEVTRQVRFLFTSQSRRLLFGSEVQEFSRARDLIEKLTNQVKEQRGSHEYAINVDYLTFHEYGLSQ